MPALSEISIYSADNTLSTGGTIQASEHNTHRNNVRSLFQDQLSYLSDLEKNFASGSEPTDTDDGKLWYDSTNTILKLRVSSAWKDMMSSGVNYDHGTADFTTTGQINCHELNPHGYTYHGVKYKYTGISAPALGTSTTDVTGFFTDYPETAGEVVVRAYASNGAIHGITRFSFSASGGSATYEVSTPYGFAMTESGGTGSRSITPSVSGSDLRLVVDWTNSGGAHSGGELLIHVFTYSNSVSAI